MNRSLRLVLALAVLAFGHSGLTSQAIAADQQLETLLQEFRKYSGCELVFHRDESS